MSELKVSSLEKLVADLVCRLQDTRLYVTALEEDNVCFFLPHVSWQWDVM